MKQFRADKIKPFLNKYWKQGLGVLAVILVLAAAFWYGGSSAGSRGWKTERRQNTTAEQIYETVSEAESTSLYQNEQKSSEEITSGSALAESEAYESTAVWTEAASHDAAEPGPGSADTVNDGHEENNSVKTGEQPQVTPQNPDTGKTHETDAPKQTTCTISVSCATILNNMDMLRQSKADFVPADGWILTPVTVTFTEGENVYDVLQRVTRERSIQMEASYTPMYGSVYVEGINNLYEFDCGELSGWMYSVNGIYPNYGCSSYILKDGDVICWVYTCDLGYDVGGGYATGE